MKLSDIGERKLIEIFAKEFRKNRCENVVVGIGDDATVLSWDDENYLVISNDMISKGSHIPKEMSPRQTGKYVVNINLSDIASMGAKPLSLVFSFGLPPDLDEDFVVELSEGINEACKEHETCILGGDTKEHSEIMISGTAFGIVGRDRLLTRSGAQIGDLVCVTGSIGLAAAGFYALVNDLNLEKNVRERAIKAALEPKARIREGIILGRYANACIDISDGLAYSLYEISRMSNVGTMIHEDKVPVDEDVKTISRLLEIKTDEVIFHKGGDYELLFTISPEKYNRLVEKMDEIGTTVSQIGEVTKEGLKLLNSRKEIIDLEPRGYESFVTNF
ncbi:MAG: thiamine-phosphate kinase [Candidatus Hydrothermarchaeales archaeon]